MIDKINELQKRTEFKPYADLPVKKVVPPIRKNVRAICELLIACDNVSNKDRLKYAQMAGIKPNEDGKYSFEVKFSEYDMLPELAKLLFEISEDEIKNPDALNEGEVYAANALFFMRRSGI